MKSKWVVGFASVTVMLLPVDPASAHGSSEHHPIRWHGHAHYGPYSSYYPPRAYGPGFVRAPNYALLLQNMYVDYMTSPAYGPNSRHCFWVC